VAPVLTFALLWVLDWRLALTTAVVLAVGIGLASLAMRTNADMTQRYHLASENVSKAVVEYVQAMPVVRTFDTGTSTFRRYQDALNAFVDVTLHWYRIAGLSSRLAQILVSPLPVLVWLGAW